MAKVTADQERGIQAGPDTAPARRGGVGERLAWRALRYPIAPRSNRLPYMLGGLTFVGVVLLVLTGIVLDQFYNPTPIGAHDSVVYTMTRVPLGDWVRALHWWAASIVLVTVLLHVIYVFWRRSYVRPREILWWSGAALLVLLFALAFTGTVLRADQEGGEALAHAVAGARLLGSAGTVLTPEFTPSTSLLARLHAAHVSVLPLLLAALIALHFWLIRHLGIHTDQAKVSTFTVHLRRLSGYGLLVVAVAGTLALLFPPGLGYPAVEGVEVTKPFWAFLWIYAAENTIGLWGMIIAPVVLFGFLFAVPLLDRRPDQAGGRARWLLGLAIVLLALYVGALVYGAVAPQMQHLGM